MGAKGRGVLIDAGLPGREIERRMSVVGLDPRCVEGVVVTHEHHDHASGIGVWARRFDIPVYIASGVDEAIRQVMGPATLKGVAVETFVPGELFEVAGLEIVAFPTSHDARCAVGFRIGDGRSTLGFATDLGIVSDPVRSLLAGADALFLESNHEEELLMGGPYPWPLKKRIRSDRGHLSNADCAVLVGELLHDKLKALVLGHLSEVNNEPRLAYQSALDALAKAGAAQDVTLLVARQDRPGTRLNF